MITCYGAQSDEIWNIKKHKMRENRRRGEVVLTTHDAPTQRRGADLGDVQRHARSKRADTQANDESAGRHLRNGRAGRLREGAEDGQPGGEGQRALPAEGVGCRPGRQRPRGARKVVDADDEADGPVAGVAHELGPPLVGDYHAHYSLVPAEEEAAQRDEGGERVDVARARGPLGAWFDISGRANELCLSDEVEDSHFGGHVLGFRPGLRSNRGGGERYSVAHGCPVRETRPATVVRMFKLHPLKPQLQ